MKITLKGIVSRSHTERLAGRDVEIVDEVNVHTIKLHPRLAALVDVNRLRVIFGGWPKGLAESPAAEETGRAYSKKLQINGVWHYVEVVDVAGITWYLDGVKQS